MEGAGSIPPVSQVYLFLGKCFSYPQDELYALLKDERIGEEFRALVEELPFTVNFKGIPSPRLPQEELESAYINSFDIGFGPSLPCPLYESAYREDTSSRDITEELLRFYEHFDVRLSDKEKDDPDPYRRAQLDFLERHLYKWAFKLDEKVQKRIKEPFYQGASAFLREVLSNHLPYLRKSVGHQVDAAKGP